MADIYDEMLELGRTIDNAGLDSAWVSEHHFASDGYLSSTMPSLGALATVTENVELGTCIALAPLYDGVQLAEDAATVDLLSNGRMTLGLAIGSNPAEFDAFGVPQEERVDRLVDQIDLLQAAWSDGPLEYDATFHDVSQDTDVTPKPVDGEIPIMLGGTAQPAVRRAARVADAWIAPSKLSVDGLKKRVDDIHAVRRREGITEEFQVYVLQHGFVADSAEEAWRIMEDGYRYSQRRYTEMFTGETVETLPDESIKELKEQAIYGTPEQVIDELETYREAVGDVHFILRTYQPGIKTGAVKECIHRLGSEVRPHVR